MIFCKTVDTSLDDLWVADRTAASVQLLFSTMNSSCTNCLVAGAVGKSIHVVLHGENFVGRILVRVQVHHPAEDRGPEPAASRITSTLRGDRAFQSKFGPIGVAQLRSG